MKKMHLSCLNQNHSLLILTLISCILVVWFTKSTPLHLWTDPAWQLKALQQYLAGESPSLNHRVEPSWGDISKNSAHWIFWHSPGTQLLAYPFMAGGVALGDALRIIAIASLIVGSLGWICWIFLFRLPLWFKIAYAISLPWIPYQTNFLFWYTAEVFVYSLTPWILLAVHRFSLLWSEPRTCVQDRSERKQDFGIILPSVLLGFAMGFVYILKYTAVFASLGALVYLGLVMHQIYKNKSHIFTPRLVLSFVLLIIFFLIPVLGLNLLNYKLSHNLNLITYTYKFNLRLRNFIYLLGFPVLALVDAESLYYYLYNIFLHPQHGVINNRIWLGFSGLPGGLLLWWLIFRSQIFKDDKPGLLAIATFFINSAAMFLIWTVSKQKPEARYFVPGSIAILPFIIQSGIHVFKSTNAKTIKTVLVLAFISYVLIPLVYGYFSFNGYISYAGKIKRTPKNYIVGPSHLYNPSLAHNNLPAVLDKLKRDFNPITDIWYIPDPICALDIPGRAIIIHAQFVSLASLQNQKFLSSLPCRVHALIPYYLEEDGRGQAIRASFVQAKGWTKKEIEGSDYACWTATLKGYR